MVAAGVITGIITSAAINYMSGLYVQQAKLAAKAEIQRLVLAAAQQAQNPPTTEASTPVPTQVFI